MKFWDWVKKKWFYWFLVISLSLLSFIRENKGGDLVGNSAYLIGTFIGSVLMIALPYWIYFKVKKIGKREKEYIYRCQHCKEAFNSEAEAKKHLKSCKKRKS